MTLCGMFESMISRPSGIASKKVTASGYGTINQQTIVFLVSIGGGCIDTVDIPVYVA